MIQINYQNYTLQDTLFNAEAKRRDYLYEVHEKWETLSPDFAKNAIREHEIFYYYENTTSTSIALEFEHCLALIQDNKSNSEINVQIQGKSLEPIKKAFDTIKKSIPEAPEPNTGDISVRFWYLGQNGPRSTHRNIAAPSWDAIHSNYASSTKHGLEKLMNNFTPSSGGQLVLWHGEPGTGKTYALRALCQAWKDWCTIEYIMDPETLLGQSPGYLASMIMDAGIPEYDDDDNLKKSKPWKLLIMEDTGELLTENARERSGQGLSRLLNVVDGFIGQGLRVLVLITTNEEFHKLHPAVSREGRCAASIKFSPLDEFEAIRFLHSHGYTKTDFKKGATLADLFALAKNKEMPKDLLGLKETHIGFRIPGV